MSTRATYEIDGHLFYIHHDGYESGAAAYFAAAVMYADKHGGLAERFLRANAQASLGEPGKSHDYYGDTDYRYIVTGASLRAERRVRDNKTRTWAPVFDGLLADFLNQYDLSNDIGHEMGRFVARGTGTVGVSMLDSEVKEKLVRAETMLENGCISNASGMAHDAWNAALLLPDNGSYCRQAATLYRYSIINLPYWRENPRKWLQRLEGIKESLIDEVLQLVALKDAKSCL